MVIKKSSFTDKVGELVRELKGVSDGMALSAHILSTPMRADRLFRDYFMRHSRGGLPPTTNELAGTSFDAIVLDEIDPPKAAPSFDGYPEAGSW